MKKVICLLAVLLAASWLPAQENKNLLSVGVGAAVPMGDTGEQLAGYNVEWGGPGGAVSLQYLRIVNERWAFGVEIGGDILSYSEENSYAGDMSYYVYGYLDGRKFTGVLTDYRGNFKTRSHSLNFMAVGRLALTPNSKVRLYVPFGAGLSYTKLDLSGGEDIYFDGTIDGEYKPGWYPWLRWTNVSDTAPMGYIGLGMELKRTETDLVSLEARYHMARLKEQDISATYKYVTVMLKLGGLF